MLPILTPSEFVALANQTLEFAYPVVEVEGEVSNFKVSKNRWVYFDITDETAKLRCFGTIYMLPAPVEDGMKIRVVAAPRLHPQFGFSLNIQTLQFSGEGSIKKAADLLAEKLEKEGLFAIERKRALPYPPELIGLIASSESAGYRDFVTILNARYGGMTVELADVQVQGEAAIGQIVRAIEWFNEQARLPDVLVITRGGGSADDLQVFSSEQVTRAVAASRIPTLVAIGHEVDISLAELAADRRASTPSNAAELLVPDRKAVARELDHSTKALESHFSQLLKRKNEMLAGVNQHLSESIRNLLQHTMLQLDHTERTLLALSPQATLQRGYSIVRLEGRVVRQSKQLQPGQAIDIQFADGGKEAKVQ